MRPSAFAVTTAIAAVMAFSTPSQAQQREMTADEVKSYFAQVQLDAMEFVRKGDVEGIGQWSDRKISDTARFRVLVEVSHDNKPRMWSVIDLSKADAQQLKAELGQAA